MRFNTDSFLPNILDVHGSRNMVSPGDILSITARWCNIGTTHAQKPMRCFLEAELGYQRVNETTSRVHRYIWDPQPGLNQWKSAQVWSIGYDWKIPSLWGGSYKLYLGFCDEENQPLTVAGAPGGKLAKRIYIGDIDLGWGWGTALLELQRKPWSCQFNEPMGSKSSCTGLEDGNSTNLSAHTECISICDTICVELDSALPQIRSIKYKDDIQYVFNPLDPEIEVRKLEGDKTVFSYQPKVFIEYSPQKVSPANLVYGAVMHLDGERIAGFSLEFAVLDKKLTITLKDSFEEKGYELIKISFPSLIDMVGEDAAMIDFYGGGRLIPLRKAIPKGYGHKYDTRNAVAVFDTAAMIAMESTCLDDCIFVMARQTEDEKRASIGAAITVGVRGKVKVASIKVPNVHKIEIELLEREENNPNWLSFAKHLRQGLEVKNRDLYRRAVYYAYYSTQGPRPEPWQVKEDSPYAVTRLNKGLTFPKILDQIKRYSRVFDGCRQAAFIYGYNRQNDEDGTSMSFPYAYETDPRAGSLEELRECIAEAEKYNMYLGLYENYDDIYLSRHVNLTHAALDECGKPWKGWIWADGLSYIIGNRKYAETGALKERVKKMTEVYGSRKSGYIDVLSSEVLRWDFDTEYPSSAETSLHYRKAVVEEFNRYGIDVVSETLVHPYVGCLGYAYHTRVNWEDTLFSGEQYIPLVAAVYHGTIGYNGAGGSRRDLLRGLVDAANYGFEVDAPDMEECIKWVFLQTFPIGLLYDEMMEDYYEEDGVYCIHYTGNSLVRVDFNKYTYEVVYQGRVVGKDWTTFVPGFKEDSWLAFSLNGGTMVYTAPEGWTDGIELRAVTLTFEGEGNEIICRVKNGNIIFDMPKSIPVRVIMKNSWDHDIGGV